ncbi:unnamed protein product [Medioppia subpectinata]|uniref:Cation-transporting ATPase n=1 Tax=Medioppia subpectinata TaxID=1979941 RepID=A0A7R9KC04_9ACAR|nr:unnamed protein product [Medioppia subpectinata]CAG2100663.1 unnamed protein product [Medioppia subpectinata]
MVITLCKKYDGIFHLARRPQKSMDEWNNIPKEFLNSEILDKTKGMKAKDMSAYERINVGEDDQLIIEGYMPSHVRYILFIMLVIISCGMVLIIITWKPSQRVRITHSRCSLDQANTVVLKDSFGEEYVEKVIQGIKSTGNCAHFFHKKIKYIWRTELNQFVKLKGLESYKCGIIYSMIEGLTSNEAILRSQLYVQIKPIWKLIVEEITGPFYVYQMFIFTIWMIQLYYQFSQSIALRKKVHSESEVSVVRDDTIVKKKSTELVPGDVIILSTHNNHFIVECDAVLMSGSCIMDESMLTGESVPISKVSLTEDPNSLYYPKTHKINTLFSGTQLLEQAKIGDIAIIVLDVATFLVPPLLPAVMTSINAHSQRRLRKKGVFCLNPNAINCCGGVDIMCFDKTGTLTEDSIDLSGVVPVLDYSFTEPIRDVSKLNIDNKLLLSLGCCHSLSETDDKVDGESLDIKLFEAIKWQFKSDYFIYNEMAFERNPERIVGPVMENEDQNEDIFAFGIVKQFPFESMLQRMIVIVKQAFDNKYVVLMKGAPELIVSFCNQTTVPKDCTLVLESYTRDGLRVLATASKEINADLETVLKLSREELESELIFEGFLVFQNILKKETIPVLKTLKNANIRSVMITGDNLLTSISVGRECGLIEESDSVIKVEAELYESPNQNQALRDTSRASLRKRPIRGTIFSRMSPDLKLNLIEVFQKQGHQVGMCGDGANDCGALRTANAGISLSVAEASVASPFTYKEKNISCVPMLISEGRATLSATIGAFKYQVCYCFVLLGAVLILFWEGNKPSDGMKSLCLNCRERIRRGVACIVTGIRVICTREYSSVGSKSQGLGFRDIPFHFKLILFTISIANFIFCYVWEVVILQGIVFNWFLPKMRSIRAPIHPYEKIELEMQSSDSWPPVISHQRLESVAKERRAKHEFNKRVAKEKMQTNAWVMRSNSTDDELDPYVPTIMTQQSIDSPDDNQTSHQFSTFSTFVHKTHHQNTSQLQDSIENRWPMTTHSTFGRNDGIDRFVLDLRAIVSIVGMMSNSSPFVSSQYSHPGFNPTKLGQRAQQMMGEHRLPKAPKPPDKPLMPYMRYSRKVWDVVKGDNPDLKLWEIGKIIGQMWRDLGDDEKQEYIEAFEAEKSYHNSPAYQSWISAKAKAQRVGDDHSRQTPAHDRHTTNLLVRFVLKSVLQFSTLETITRVLCLNTSLIQELHIFGFCSFCSVLSSQLSTNQSIATSIRLTVRFSSLQGFPSPQKQSEGKVCIQAADDDEDCDEFSVKHLATARYQRNHRLINEIFSDSIVPDVRSVVTNARMQVLKRQVQSLTMHQKKLEAELQQIEEKFVHKKRKFIEASDQFKEEIRKKCATKAVDANTFKKMVDKALEQIKKDHALREEQMVKNTDKVEKMETQDVVTEAPVETTDTAKESVESEGQQMSALENTEEPKDTQNTEPEAESEMETQSSEPVDQNKEVITTATTDENSGFASNDSQQTDTNETNSDEIVKESLKIGSDSQESSDLAKEESAESVAQQQ